MPLVTPNAGSLRAQSLSAAASGLSTAGQGTQLFSQAEVGVTARAAVMNWTGDQTLQAVFYVQTGVLGGAANGVTPLMTVTFAAGNVTPQTVVLTAAGLTQTSGAGATLTGTAGHLTAPLGTVVLFVKPGGVPTVGSIFVDYQAN